MNTSANIQLSTLLMTKFSCPAAQSPLVPRARLIELLNEGLHHRLTLITAPAGAGKTTLLSTWYTSLEQVEVQVTWVSLDKGDNDPVRFWRYVVAALATLRSEIAEVDAVLLSSTQPALAESALAQLIHMLTHIPGSCVLVLDDYHEITTPAITEVLTSLLAYLPPHIHLFISSWEEPNLPLARLRARGQLHQLDQEDLRFTRDEAALFLSHIAGLSLSNDEVNTLETCTEGWITGLKLAALSCSRHNDITDLISAFAGDHHYVADYFFSEVLSKQPEYIQTFLLSTAILARLSAPLCNALLHRDDAQTILELLEQHNLFIVQLDSTRHWYRYHQLFRDFLVTCLQRTPPTVIADLHLRASAWYEQNGLSIQAVEHALAAHDFTLALALIERAADTMIERRELHTLLGWFEALPAAQLGLHPRLNLLRARVLLSIGKVDAAEHVLAELAGNAPFAADITTLRAIIAATKGDMRQGTELTHLALEHLAGDRSSLHSFIALNQGTVHSLSGHGGAADEAFSEAYTLSLAHNDLYLAQIAQCQQANLGTGKPLASATKMLIATQSVYHDHAHLLALLLPAED